MFTFLFLLFDVILLFFFPHLKCFRTQEVEVGFRLFNCM